MSRRRRAVAFLLLAAMAAAAAAAIADRYGTSVARGYGPLRPVVVATADLPAGKVLGPGEISGALTVRHVPARFAPVDALGSTVEAVGLAPSATVPAGSYLVASQLQASQAHRKPRWRGDRRPVEISLAGAGALLEAGPAGAGARVDVVVTTEPDGAGPGRTYVAAAEVPLLALRAGVDGPGGTDLATLALTKSQALRLIAAESFARRMTLLPGR